LETNSNYIVLGQWWMGFDRYDSCHVTQAKYWSIC